MATKRFGGESQTPPAKNLWRFLLVLRGLSGDDGPRRMAVPEASSLAESRARRLGRRRATRPRRRRQTFRTA